jgi:hypothetical protein
MSFAAGARKEGGAHTENQQDHGRDHNSDDGRLAGSRVGKVDGKNCRRTHVAHFSRANAGQVFRQARTEKFYVVGRTGLEPVTDGL